MSPGSTVESAEMRVVRGVLTLPNGEARHLTAPAFTIGQMLNPKSPQRIAGLSLVLELDNGSSMTISIDDNNNMYVDQEGQHPSQPPCSLKEMMSGAL